MDLKLMLSLSLNIIWYSVGLERHLFQSRIARDIYQTNIVDAKKTKNNHIIEFMYGQDILVVFCAHERLCTSWLST